MSGRIALQSTSCEIQPTALFHFAKFCAKCMGAVVNVITPLDVGDFSLLKPMR
jgi:hypothetical protein